MARNNQSQAPAPRVIVVPTLDEVRAAGYTSPGVAENIVAAQKAMADALAANPQISDAELRKIEEEIRNGKTSVSALESRQGRAWLAAQLAHAEMEEQRGPDGLGWTHNEGKRAEIKVRAEFLRALTALLN